MHIFNQGKYKSLHAQQEGELAKIRQQVCQDTDYRPTYHISPETGLLNDPNGLIFDGEKYHLFYQWFPYGAMHGMKHWRHLMTKDFQHFCSGDTLIPDRLFESHGCYSGGAILWQDQIVAFYTGNTRNAENKRIPHQNIAIFDKSGKLKQKRCLLACPPQGYTEHCRDPKPFLTHEGKIRFVLGAQRENLTGTALIYEMDNLQSNPVLLGELTLERFNNQDIFMWECPDLLTFDGKGIFLWSPQGKKQQSRCFQNNYHSIYAVGQLTDTKFITEHIDELDQGFDFYAPQSIWQGQGIYFAWVGLPDMTYPTDQFQWHSILTMPRQLQFKQGKLFQQPIEAIYNQMNNYQQYQIENEQIIPNLDRSYLKFKPSNGSFQLECFSNLQGQKLIFSYEKGIFSLNRSLSEQTETMKKFGDIRYCEIEQLDCVEIFFDRSVVEIFLNQGERVMTSRFFIPQRENTLRISRPIVFSVAELTPISIR
ncbi:sucrose-6-phosphate hydrolase [[Haemophilus] felis]|nr:sucrose-6-phosphate hydrolase [[Haemophilus] felis]